MARSDSIARNIPALTVFVALAVTVAVLQRLPKPVLLPSPLAGLSLPDSLAGYAGAEILFCQNEQCLQSFRAHSLDRTDQCPACTQELHALSFGERRVLPADTILRRKIYSRPGKPDVLVSLLVSGEERTSIHRPQMCLQAQGWHIEEKHIREVSVPNRQPLPVTHLAVTTHRATSSGEAAVIDGSFIYWFAGLERETPHNLTLMFWMAADKIIRNHKQRWAYISVMSFPVKDMEQAYSDVAPLIGELYPLVAATRAKRED